MNDKGESQREEVVEVTTTAPPVAEAPATTTTLTDARLDPDKMMLEDIDTWARGPRFSVSDMALVFFARSNHWVRHLETKGVMVLDGIPLETKRTPTGARVYDLFSIELLAHALAQNGVISGTQLRQCLTMVRVQAEMHEYI